jgi:Ca2+-transporting ATPase
MGTSVTGLTGAEAAARLRADGPNEIDRTKPASAAAIFLGQFRGVMIWMLLAAAALSATLGERADAIAIAVIVVLNAIVGFAQEFRAARAMEALRAMTAPHARVLRDGAIAVVATRDIVKDDVIVLDAGDIVPADARLFEANDLRANEAALTGESAPVDKTSQAAPKDAPLAERVDSVFQGTAVATGSARALVTATGMQTELGRIAKLVADVQSEPTPLEKQLDRVGGMLLRLCLLVVAVVAALALFHGETWLNVLLSSVSLAVAAVPEGLAAVVTIALAIGLQRMAQRRVLVRKLPAVETLGSATVICTDKTGTLTTGRMRVREVWGPDHHAVLDVAAACSDAELDALGKEGTGDPTEVAILLAAADRGIHRVAIETERPRAEVHPFRSEARLMSIARADGTLYAKGALDAIGALRSGGASIEEAEAANADMAARGLRVLAVGRGRGTEERDLELLGLIGIADPPRPEAIQAIADARRAGIRVVMITGDHAITALAIAKEMGIVREGEATEERVYARATPDDKLRIVRDLKTKGEIVAMTGDGVNDAPALREAHIGIAMGKGGTDVAREASAMVLTDDDFASIVNAVREGRGVFDNVQKTLVYLLSGNVAELAFVLGASLLGMPLPLTALQILWINLVTDGLPALALVADGADPDVMARPPRSPSQPMLGRAEWMTTLAIAAIEASVVLGTYAWALAVQDLAHARELAFSVLALSEVMRSLAARSHRRVFFQTGIGSNLALLGVVIATVAVQLSLHAIPLARTLLELSPFSLPDSLLALGLGAAPVTLLELGKLGRRSWARSAPATA